MGFSTLGLDSSLLQNLARSFLMPGVGCGEPKLVEHLKIVRLGLHGALEERFGFGVLAGGGKSDTHHVCHFGRLLGLRREPVQISERFGGRFETKRNGGKLHEGIGLMRIERDDLEEDLSRFRRFSRCEQMISVVVQQRG